MDTPSGRLLNSFENSLEEVLALVDKMEDNDDKIDFILELQHNLQGLKQLTEHNAHMAVLSSVCLLDEESDSKLQDQEQVKTAQRSGSGSSSFLHGHFKTKSQFKP